MKTLLILFMIQIAACGNFKIAETVKEVEPKMHALEQPLIKYTEFKPEVINELELNGFEIMSANKLDDLFILSAYSEGDLESSDKPQDWGDRLVVYRNGDIVYQSKGVGDVYLYEPHFYKNEVNDSVVIICQLGFEYYFGGEAFLLDNGNIEYIGLLDIESADWETGLTDVIMINEVADELIFNFDSDSLIYKPGELDSLIINNDIHYSYKEQVLQLKGM